MKKAISFGLALAFVLSFFVVASAEPVSLFYGQQWDRYDYQVFGGSYVAVPAKSNNTFTIPRTYLRYKLTDDALGYEGNITLDINNVNDGENSKITITGGNVTAAGGIDWAIWVKKASVDFKKIPILSDIDAIIRVGQQDVYFGAIDTWQYPVIEKAMEDKNSIVSSADQGIALLGKIPQGYGAYELAVYNGSGYKTTDNDATNGDITDKAYDASLLLTPIAGIYARASYLHKLTNSLGTKTAAYNASAFVVGGASGPIEAFVEYVTDNAAKNHVAGTKSGVAVGVSGYIGVKLADALSVHFRADTYNPDTLVKLDEMNTFIVGMNLKLTSMTVLQLNYQLDKFVHTMHGASDNNLTNNNQFLAQLVWSW